RGASPAAPAKLLVDHGPYGRFAQGRKGQARTGVTGGPEQVQHAPGLEAHAQVLLDEALGHAAHGKGVFRLHPHAVQGQGVGRVGVSVGHQACSSGS
ncbi:MAG: hypothetical protein AMXMBFR83_08110, partial [Phycisphaerae bacterium]